MERITLHYLKPLKKERFAKVFVFINIHTNSKAKIDPKNYPTHLKPNKLSAPLKYIVLIPKILFSPYFNLRLIQP